MAAERWPVPSSLHQTVIDLLRHAPELVPQLLGLAGAAAPATRRCA